MTEGKGITDSRHAMMTGYVIKSIITPPVNGMDPFDIRVIGPTIDAKGLQNNYVVVQSRIGTFRVIVEPEREGG